LGTESFKRAFELHDRATKHDRFQLEGQYYGQVTDELEKSTGVFRKWASAYPREYLPHAYLGYVLRLRGEYQNAIDEAREAIRLNPDDYHPVFNLMLAEMALERPEEAKAAYDRALSHNLDSTILRWLRYEVAFLEHDEASMKEQVAWSAGKPSAQLLLDDESDTAAYYGRLVSARAFHRRAADAAKRENNQYQDVLRVVGEAQTEAEVGNVHRADELLRPLTGLDMDRFTLSSAAIALARANRVTEAESKAAQLSQLVPLSTTANNYTLPSIRAAIELSRDNPGGAVTALQPATRNAGTDLGYPAYLRGLAYLRLAEPHEAQVEFQKLIDHPGIVGLCVTGALAHLQLGRAQAMADDKEAARKSYQDCLTLWKDADPDIPIYQQAKAEYAKLNKPLATSFRRRAVSSQLSAKNNRKRTTQN
jgi:tetratricopeptide (TPR) repeat protein